MEISLYENCLKFIDSDVFIYEENPDLVYMIYVDYKEKVPETININEGSSLKEQANLYNPKSEDNISSVKEIVSNVNFEEMKDGL